MPRTARAIVADHCYHLVNRGNNQAPIFHEWADYAAFLSLVSKTQECIEVPILAACLMPNHLHLVVRPVEKDDVARWTQRLFTTHVRHHHRKYLTSGRLWQGRFKAFVIQQDEHLVTVIRYVERNALRAGLVTRAEDWRWGKPSMADDGGRMVPGTDDIPGAAPAQLGRLCQRTADSRRTGSDQNVHSKGSTLRQQELGGAPGTGLGSDAVFESYGKTATRPSEMMNVPISQNQL